MPVCERVFGVLVVGRSRQVLAQCTLYKSWPVNKIGPMCPKCTSTCKHEKRQVLQSYHVANALIGRTALRNADTWTHFGSFHLEN